MYCMNDIESPTPLPERQPEGSNPATQPEGFNVPKSEVSSDRPDRPASDMTTSSHTDSPEKQKQKVIHRSLIGDVIRDKMEKTIVVEVSALKSHPLYRKQYLRSKRYHVHDPKNVYRVGDRVEILPMRPLSKTKRWTVLRKLS